MEDKTFRVFYWDGEDLDSLYMDVSPLVLADYLTKEHTFLTGSFCSKLIALKTEQIVSIEEV